MKRDRSTRGKAVEQALTLFEQLPVAEQERLLAKAARMYARRNMRVLPPRDVTRAEDPTEGRP